MGTDILPAEQAADVLKAVASVLSAVALPVVIFAIVAVLRSGLGEILGAIAEHIRGAENLEARLGTKDTGALIKSSRRRQATASKESSATGRKRLERAGRTPPDR